MFTYHVNDQVILELQSPSQAEEHYALLDENRDFLRPWMSWVDRAQSVADMARLLMRDLLGMVDGLRWSWIIRNQDQIAGRISVKRDDHEAEIGYWLGEAHTGKGIMTAAVQTVVDWCFTELALKRIVLIIDADNEKSLALPERLGFIPEATAREEVWENGKPRDMVTYGLLRDEWTITSRPTFAYDLGEDADLRLYQIHHVQRGYESASRNKADLERWLHWIHNYSLERELVYTRQQLRAYAEGKALRCGIWQLGGFAGSITLNVEGDGQQGNIGYWLDNAYRGRGLMTRAVGAMLSYGFDTMGLNRIVVKAAVENTTSRDVARRTGMLQEAVLHQESLIGGRWLDNAVYSMLREDWEQII